MVGWCVDDQGGSGVPRHGAVRPTFHRDPAVGSGGAGQPLLASSHPPVLSTGRAKVAQSSGESTIAVVNILLSCSCINIP